MHAPVIVHFENINKSFNIGFAIQPIFFRSLSLFSTAQQKHQKIKPQFRINRIYAVQSFTHNGV